MELHHATKRAIWSRILHGDIPDYAETYEDKQGRIYKVCPDPRHGWSSGRVLWIGSRHGEQVDYWVDPEEVAAFEIDTRCRITWK